VLSRKPGGGFIERTPTELYDVGSGSAACMNANGTFLQPYLGMWVPLLYTSSGWWTLIGFAGNLLFSSRFVFQWLISEKRKKVIVPAHFWYLSFWGSVLNLIYALHIDNAPIVLGVIALPIIYGRNIILLHSEKPRGTVKNPVLRTRLGPA
jgi:lipid-A-disaccharide synthase-like uncharacterized protein